MMLDFCGSPRSDFSSFAFSICPIRSSSCPLPDLLHYWRPGHDHLDKDEEGNWKYKTDILSDTDGNTWKATGDDNMSV